jgi:phenylpropionate dioxygenase-like ring-hydroxylating dioxygenase large terminal subunit
MEKSLKSLPGWTYTSNKFLELEKQELILKNWQLVCHLSNIPDTGNFFTFEIFNQRIFVIKGEDGNVEAFHNFCSHRGTKLLDQVNGTCIDKITCPYHAWGYDFKGNLIKVPYEDQFKDFSKKDHKLKSVSLEIFQGFVFVKLINSNVPSVNEQFLPYIDEISQYKLEEVQPLGRVTMRLRKVNWKQIADNYVDALHIPVAHPGLSGLVHKSYGLEVSPNKGYIHKMWGDGIHNRKNNLSNLLYDKYLPHMEHLSENRQRYWLYYRLWPNLAFDIYPEQMDFMQFIPIDANTTMIREIAYALPDERRETKASQYLNWRINRQVNKEDTQLINLVQEGMNTNRFESGPLAATEVCLIDSADKIRKAIPVAELKAEPAESEIFKLNSEMQKDGKNK